MVESPFKLIQKLKRESLKPLYLVHGTEPFYIDMFLNRIIDIAVPDFEKSFNEFILYGKDLSVGDLISYARKFPMMADKQLILVKDAQNISDIGQKDSIAALEAYLKNPLESTILVLGFTKDQDMRKSWVKAFAQKGEILYFKKMYDNQIPEFIQTLVQDKGLKINMKATHIMVDHIGNNLQAIANEINKIRLNLLNPGVEIDAEIVEKYVGISKDFNAFELQKAIVDRNSYKCYQMVKYFGANPKDHPIQPTLMMIYNLFSKVLLLAANMSKPESELAGTLGVNPYFLKDYRKALQNYPFHRLVQIVSALRIADQQSKGIDVGAMNEEDILNELLFKILELK